MAVVSSVDITLSNSIDAVLKGRADIVLISRKLLNQMVVTGELIVKHGDSELSSRSKASIVYRLVGTNGIIPVDDSFTSGGIESSE